MSGSRQFSVEQSSVRQGRRLTIELVPECRQPGRGVLRPSDRRVADLDEEPDTFTFETTEVPIGSYTLAVDCGSGLTMQTDLLVFRQNGAERGGANSVVMATSVGLGSAAALLGLPGLLAAPSARRRDSFLDDLVDER